MKTFGLIGKSLAHSFSKKYFEEKFLKENINGVAYHNFELPEISQINKILEEHKNIRGFNITNPYKEEILPFLNEISEEAKSIGAVNCVKVKDGTLIGYNTDAFGFATSIKPFLEPAHGKALVLGSGGAAKAVAYALEKTGVEVYFVSRKKLQGRYFGYDQLNEIVFKGFKLIVNTTPLGMYPNEKDCPDLPFEWINESHFCYDLIYNPAETVFLEKSRKQGAKTMNGYGMLQLQAEKSWEIWNRD